MPEPQSDPNPDISMANGFSLQTGDCMHMWKDIDLASESVSNVIMMNVCISANYARKSVW